MSLPDVIDRILPRTAAVLRETALFGLLVGGSAAGWAAQWIRGQSNRNDPHLDWSPIGSRCSSSTHNGDAPTDVSSANPCLRPLRLRGVTLKNRIVRAAAFGGGTIDQLITTHVEVAKGGAALTTVAYASVSATGRTFSSQLVLTEEAVPSLRRLTGAVHAAGGKIAVQLTHAGAFANRGVTGVTQIAPSCTFNPAGWDFAREMTDAEADDIIRQFATAAAVAVDGGFDAVELHVGHGYLLSQFLTPFCNRRSGKYGGPTAADRLACPLAVLRAVRASVGEDVPIIVKMNVTDGLPSPGWGLTLSDAIEAARGFEQGGADALVLSGGTVSRSGFAMLTGDVPRFDMARAMPGWLSAIGLIFFGWLYVPEIPFEEAFFRGQARAVLSAVERIPVGLIGGVTTVATINGALSEGFGFVQMARALIRQPDFVRRIELAAKTPDLTIASPCIHCNQCVVATLDPNRPVECPERRAGQSTPAPDLTEW